MAIHAHSTPVPTPQRGLLRAFSHPRALAPNHREIPGSCLPAHPLADPESTALAALLEPVEAAEARALHSRRALIQAVEHGFALLDALDLPPLALDAVDDAIAALDALEAPDEDLEPSLVHPFGMGWHDPASPLDGEDDSEDYEETSLETAGRGFVRCGADDDEDGFDIEEQHDAERENEHGSEDEPYPWRFQPDVWALVAEAHHG